MARNINTPAINMDVNPGLWLGDELVQRLGGPVCAYVNLMAHATILSATTGSEYVDGDFDVQAALLRVRHLEDHLDTLVAAGLVAEVDGVRWHVDLRQTTSHEKLQTVANSHGDRNAAKATTRANNATEDEAKRDKADRRRAKDAERKRAQRERDRQRPPLEDSPPSVVAPDGDDVPDEDRAWAASQAGDDVAWWEEKYVTANVEAVLHRHGLSTADDFRTMSDERKRQVIADEARRHGVTIARQNRYQYV